MVNYKIIKGNLLTDEEKEILTRLLGEYCDKIDLFLKKYILEVHIKEYDREGKRKRYCLISKIKVPKLMFETEVMGWDFKVVIHKAMKKLLKEMKHKFKK
ncbi:MAG: hypothetical protein ABIJ20_03200 [Nanoarchaeota archaeon]|nr:hypothetical protein [Nanoarchaeota archaeon]MBU1444697.1 hypothetical protein [Nanoarchaeota archaeon]MBU2420549.1 hypothetical protein [Nanoarchaeota archaeon]MBU2475772.1 hypothetical protein [Nanoarchaeota archaeon]